MSSKRLNRILMAVVGLMLIALAGGVYGVNGLLSKHAADLTKLKARSQALDEEQVQLKKAKQDVKKYAQLEKIAGSVVPEDKSQAEAVREIVNIAAANNVKLASISFPASTLGNAPTGAKSGQAATVAPNPNSAASRLSQLEPVKNIPGVYLLQIVVTGDPNQPVRYDKFISFLQALEHNRRTAQVSAITLQPSTANRNFLSFSLTVNGYIKP